MRFTLLLALVACNGGGGGGEPLADQLRGAALNVDGDNVLHGSGPSREERTDLGQVAVHADLTLFDGFVPVRVVGEAPDWELEVQGDDPFVLIVDDQGFLEGLACFPPDTEAYSADLVLTAPSQPGREYRVHFACEGSDSVRFLGDQFTAWDVAGDGTIVGMNGRPVVLPPGELEPRPLEGIAGTYSQFASDDAGGFVFKGTDHRIHHRPAGASEATAVLDTQHVSFPHLSADGERVVYSFDNRLYRLDLTTGQAEAVSEGRTFEGLVWSSTDARWAVTKGGPRHTDVRNLLLHDLDEGTDVPLTRPDGAPWTPDIGFELLALSQNLQYGLFLTSYFGTVGLTRIDLLTGEETEYLDAATAHAAEHFGDNHNIDAWDVTPDLRYAAVTFDNVTVYGSGFNVDGTAAYVIDLETGDTWVASVTPNGELLRPDELLQHVRLFHDGSAVVFGNHWIAERSAWVEVP